MIRKPIRFIIPALRYILKNRVFVVLNLLGLSIGLSASLLLIQYALYEFSYDKFHKNSDQIYRVRYDNYRNGVAEFESAAAVPAVGRAMKENFPEVLEFAWAYPVKNGFFKVGVKSFHEDKFQVVTPGFLKMFSWKFIHGDTSALSQPHSLVITESCALKNFGTTDVRGQVIQYEDGTEYTVQGIIEDVPGNSHIKFSILVSADVMYPWIESLPREIWTWYDFNTYIQLKEGTDPEKFDIKFDKWVSQELADFWKKSKRRQYFRLQSIEKIHLYSKLSQESEPDESGNAKQVIILSLVAISILVIAWINYINLSNSMTWARTREIALRKVAGADKKHIITLFVGEALLMNTLAAALCLGIIELSLPGFSDLIGREMSMSLLGDQAFWIILVILLTLGSFISGIYPAMSMSIRKPVEIITGRQVGFRTGLLLRKILVIIQFTVSIGFISSAFLAYSQLHFIRSIPTGIHLDQTLVVWGPGIEFDSSYSGNDRNFKNSISNLPEVKSITTSNSIPGIEIFLSEILRRPGEETGMIIYNLSVDEEYIPSYGLDLVSGRNFHPIMDNGKQSLILNVCAAKHLGFTSPEEAIGEKLIFMDEERTIVGIIKDYHQMSTKQTPRPLAHYYNPRVNTYLSVKLKSLNINETIAVLEYAWKEHFAGVPFEFFFLDEVCEMQYRMDKQINKALRIFAALAIFIAALGLFGLSTFTTQQRSKEIGIRKVNGASIMSILLMLFKEYLELIFISFLIAIPLTWLSVQKWLNTYEVHIKIQIHVFLLGGLIVLLTALLFVSIQTIRVANMNPTKALRSY